MTPKKHPSGLYRAYKKINNKEYQHYFSNPDEAQAMQEELDKKSKLFQSLKAPNLFSQCGRLALLRVRRYKKTNKPTLQLQVSVNGRQKKSETTYKGSFEDMWSKQYKLWREHFKLSTFDIREHHSEIKKAKRLYMQDTHAIIHQEENETP